MYTLSFGVIYMYICIYRLYWGYIGVILGLHGDMCRKGCYVYAHA